MTQEDSLDIVIERVFDAPRELVWKLWTEPEHVAQWWGPRGMTTRVDELDLRPGGSWRYVMLAPDGSEYPQSGTFREIVPPETIVTSAAFEGGSYVLPQEVVMTYRFDDLGGQDEAHHAYDARNRRRAQSGVGDGRGPGLGLELRQLRRLPGNARAVALRQHILYRYRVRE